MKKDKPATMDAAELRRMAEEKLKATKTEDLPSIAELDAQRLVHELQVHQIELEVQNEELRQAWDNADVLLAWYTDLYDFAPVGYFTLDIQGNISHVNLTGAKLLGVNRSRLVNGRFGILVSPETRRTFNAFIEGVFESRTKQTCEVVLLTEAGTPIYVRIEAVVPKDGEECRMAVMDITERTQAEEALALSNKQVTRILESISDAFLALDRDWRFTYVNTEAERILRHSRQELVGTNIWIRFHEAVGTDFQLECERAVLENVAVQFESYLPYFERWLEVRAYPYEGGLSVYFRDCSDHRAAREAMARSSERSAHIADVLQQTLIPPQMPMQPVGYEISARYQPGLSEAEVCGDFYDLFDLGDGKLGIVIGDVVGKGLPAAARVAAVKHTMRSYAFLGGCPSNVMTLVNDALFRETATENDMLTAFFAILDTRVGELTYTSAGHEPPLLMHADGRTECLTTGDPMLSGIGTQAYNESNLELQPGDLLVLITDGITESRRVGRSEQFGTEGVIRCLSGNAGISVEDIASNLLADALLFAEGSLRDDVAIVMIRKVGKTTP